MNRTAYGADRSRLRNSLLATSIVAIGLLIAVYPIRPGISAFGSTLLVLMACTILSFLFTAPEVWVPARGDANHGFPYLSRGGRLIVKDRMMLAAAVVTLAGSGKTTPHPYARVEG